MTLPEILKSPSPAQPDSREDTSTQAPRYQLRANRASRYKCGTCGSRNCSCVHQITIEPRDLRLARVAAIPACELALARTPEHPQYGVLAVRTQRQESFGDSNVSNGYLAKGWFLSSFLSIFLSATVVK